MNRAKARARIARIHAKIADCRLDNLHKLSRRLINANQVGNGTEHHNDSSTGAILIPASRYERVTTLLLIRRGPKFSTFPDVTQQMALLATVTKPSFRFLLQASSNDSASIPY